MVPDVAIRLRAMLRSLRETIIPAIDPGSALALEQAHAMIQHLEVLAVQHDKLHQFELADLRDYHSLTHELRDRAEGGQVTRAALRDTAEILRQTQSLAAAEPVLHERIVEQVRSLKAAADSLVAAAHEDGSPSFRNEAVRLVMSWSAKQIERERAWARAAGFDAFAEQGPSLENILLD